MTMTGSTVLSQSCARASACKQSNNSPFCTAPLRSLSGKSTFRGGNLAQHSRGHQRTSQQRYGSSLIVQAGLGEVGKYLSEAATAVFSPTKEDVPWSGGKSPFNDTEKSNLQSLTRAEVLVSLPFLQVTSLAKCPIMRETFHVYGDCTRLFVQPGSSWLAAWTQM